MPPSRSRIVDPAGRITTFVVDTDGDLVRKVCPELCVTEFRYDAEHRLVASVDSDGYRTSYSYDSIDRLRSVRTPDNERTTFTYVDWLTTRRTEPNNAHTTLVFNALRQLERVIEPNG